jgi:hypothetical protein
VEKLAAYNVRNTGEKVVVVVVVVVFQPDAVAVIESTQIMAQGTRA